MLSHVFHVVSHVSCCHVCHMCHVVMCVTRVMLYNVVSLVSCCVMCHLCHVVSCVLFCVTFFHAISGVLKISLAGANNLVPTTSLTPCIIIIHVYICIYRGAGKNIGAR